MLNNPTFSKDDVATAASFYGPARFTIILGYFLIVLGPLLIVGAVVGALFWP
jgi:hypothetical protein